MIYFSPFFFLPFVSFSLMTRRWIHVKKTNHLLTGFGRELRRILGLPCPSFSNPRPMTVQRLAGWQLHPKVSQGLDSLLGPPGSEFREVQYSSLSETELGFMLETGQPSRDTQGGKHISYFPGDDPGLECLQVNESILPDKFLFLDASGPPDTLQSDKPMRRGSRSKGYF